MHRFGAAAHRVEVVLPNNTIGWASMTVCRHCFEVVYISDPFRVDDGTTQGYARTLNLGIEPNRGWCAEDSGEERDDADTTATGAADAGGL